MILFKNVRISHYVEIGSGVQNFHVIGQIGAVTIQQLSIYPWCTGQSGPALTTSALLPLPTLYNLRYGFEISFLFRWRFRHRRRELEQVNVCGRHRCEKQLFLTLLYSAYTEEAAVQNNLALQTLHEIHAPILTVLYVKAAYKAIQRR